MYAAEGGHQEVCTWLADRGADPTASDRVGCPVLLAASVDPRVSLISLLKLL